MTSLLAVLTPIALLDSTSITPLCIVPLIALMSGRSPLLRVAGFLSGIFVAYVVAGIAVLFGLGAVIELLNRHLDRFIYDPGTLDIVFQLIVGAAMLGFGWAMASAREDHGDRGLGLGDVSPGQAFTGAAALTLVGMPGAFPYFAAVDLQTRRQEELKQGSFL